ncbi:hypothetical protein [Draconibacterium orientale]|uniref:hypothetical protein n=1 Tax=Draconibacterium orientale TaxID=1168034 RepID=UPI0029C0EFFC|nr:hypothetical protein [Draconibacterium orientale]
MEKRKVYYNNPQLEFQQAQAHTSVIVGGRRLGKTHGFASPWTLRNVQQMPRSSGGVVGAAFQRILTQTLPGTLQALEDMGYRRDLHYYVGHRPPKSAGFAKPVREPARYDHVISWYNGSIWYLISQDIPGTSNSLTLQYLLVDEAKFVDFDKLKDETFPANGGFKGPWAGCPWLNSMLIMSDMPATKKGSWFLKYREEMDKELIAAILQLVQDIYDLKQKPQNTYTKKLLYQKRLLLAQFRSVAVYYREWSSIENVELLGKKYIAQMKRDLPPLVFQTSIMCIRPGKLKDGFYPALSDKYHLYTAYNNSYLQNLDYDLKKAAEQDCRQDGDVDLDKPISIAFDYNANINWLVAGQKDGMKMKVLKSFYVKYERKLRELVDDFCNYYRFHHSREVVYYFDNTALGSNYAVSDEDFASVICSQFEKNGWNVTRVHIGNPLKHHEKYLMIDQALKGQKYLFVQINEQNNEALVPAMRQTGVKVGAYGFQKDKSGEKLAETEEDRLEYRTDGTDAFDTLFVGMNFYSYETAARGVGMGVMRG